MGILNYFSKNERFKRQFKKYIMNYFKNWTSIEGNEKRYSIGVPLTYTDNDYIEILAELENSKIKLSNSSDFAFVKMSFYNDFVANEYNQDIIKGIVERNGFEVDLLVAKSNITGRSCNRIIEIYSRIDIGGNNLEDLLFEIIELGKTISAIENYFEAWLKIQEKNSPDKIGRIT